LTAFDIYDIFVYHDELWLTGLVKNDRQITKECYGRHLARGQVTGGPGRQEYEAMGGGGHRGQAGKKESA